MICFYTISFVLMQYEGAVTKYHNWSIHTYTRSEEIWFKGKEIARILGYINTRDALLKHVDPKDKEVWANLQGVASHDSLGIQPHTVLINESGLYSLILRSKLPHAKKFKRWVTSEVLPSIRRLGYYENSNYYSLNFKIEDEKDLHYKVVDYIRSWYPDSLIVAGLGELQDTPWKRISSYKKGYQKGQPDIIINNYHKKYNGMCIL